jgi:hypothetical protein
MHQEVAEVHQNPLGGFVAFHAVRHVASGLQSCPYLIRDRLALLGVIARANDEIIRKGGDTVQVENLDVDGLFRIGRSNCGQPTGNFFVPRNFFFQTRLPTRYRTLVEALKLRITLLAFASAVVLCAQTSSDLASEDPSVLRARMTVDKVRGMVESGTLPRIRLDEAEARLEDITDEAAYTRAIYGKDLTPDQASEVVRATQRRVDRRKKEALKQEQFLTQGIISQSEYKLALDDLDRATKEYEWASARENLVAEVAAYAAAEIALLKQMEDGAPAVGGARMEHYAGKGSFTIADFARVQTAFRARFSRAIPISANGETAVHRSMGFDHSNRIDVPVTPDSAEGQWLRQFLTANRIPFFAFRGAVAHQATGAHIHMGPPSTRYVQARSTSALSGAGN